MAQARPPFAPADFKKLIIEEDDTLCVALKNLTQLSVMFWMMIRFKYKPDQTGFTQEYLLMLQGFECPDPPVAFDGITPNPQDFKNFMVSPSSSFCEKFVKIAGDLTTRLYEYFAFEYNEEGTDFSDEFKALICGVDCEEPPEIDFMAMLNYRNFLRWDVVSGEVDLMGIAPWNFVPSGVGFYVDLAGTLERPKVNDTVWNGGIRTKATHSFPLVTGRSYRITYTLAGNWVSDTNYGKCRVRVLRADGTQYEAVDVTHTPSSSDMPFTTQTIDFTAGSDEAGALLQFENTQRGGYQNVGPKIDDIVVRNLTSGIDIFIERFEDEFLGRGDSSIDIELPDPDDAKAAIPIASLALCEKLAKIVLDFPREVYNVVAWEFNSAGSGFSSDMKYMICNPVATLDPEGPVEEDDNGYLFELQAYWNHNEANSDVLDEHGGHSLVEDGGILSSETPGILDTCRGYPGSVVARAASGVWNTLEGGDWTIAGWVKLAAAGGLIAFVNKGYNAANTYSIGYTGSSGDQFFVHASGVNAIVDIAGGLQVDEWYFVCARARQVGGSIELQISYGHDGTITHGAEVAAGASPADVGEDFMLGGVDAGGVLGSCVDGMMDDWAMWKRVLSDTRVTTLYGAGTPIPFDDWTL